MAEDSCCTDCKKNTVVVIDHVAGDTVCSECGLVLEERYIDETPEWRNFAPCEYDPVRIGAPVNPLLGDAGLATSISERPDGDSSLARLQNRHSGGERDRAIFLGFKAIADLADRLSLVGTIKDRASEMYRRLKDQKCTRGRNLDTLVAACIYIACRKEGKPRTLKEICAVANGATKKEIARAKVFIVKQLKVEMGESMEMGTVQAGNYLRRFCSNLGMSSEEIKAVEETVENLEGIDLRKAPSSIAAGIIYMITQLSDSEKSLKDIEVVTKEVVQTIKNAYKELYPYASRIIPEWYTKDINLAERLTNPER